jgi:hypothetical protein
MAQELKTKSTPAIQRNSNNLTHHSNTIRAPFEDYSRQFENNSRQLALWLTPSLNLAHLNEKVMAVCLGGGGFLLSLILLQHRFGLWQMIFSVSLTYVPIRVWPCHIVPENSTKLRDYSETDR